MSTAIAVAVFAVLLAMSLGLYGLTLWLGTRWVRAESTSLRRVAKATALVAATEAGIFLVAEFASTRGLSPAIAGAAQILASVVVPCMIIKGVFRLRPWQAVKAWCPTLLTSVAMVALVFAVVRPFVFEGFTTPGCSMAPTVLGLHGLGTCTDCGEPAYYTPVEARLADRYQPPMICDKFHVTPVSQIDGRIESGDRFLAAKFLGAKRWDLVIFRDPDNPETKYIKRLVGLPGETIVIKAGSIWADGEEIEIPDHLLGLEYVTELPRWPGPPLWGTPEQPAVLSSDDEYFVLGDFSVQSKDSRIGWSLERPYALPRSNIDGVVTHIYWPPNRWRILR